MLHFVGGPSAPSLSFLGIYNQLAVFISSKSELGGWDARFAVHKWDRRLLMAWRVSFKRPKLLQGNQGAVASITKLWKRD